MSAAGTTGEAGTTSLSRAEQIKRLRIVAAGGEEGVVQRVRVRGAVREAGA
ncbi:hypothetical protein ABIA39_002649 [Nocardia sp. GAS34]|uniref:hypothetical protein n=1 Tax=unclassified Nocardia TaxID=2637762 RepID=UPI003D2523CA